MSQDAVVRVRVCAQTDPGRTRDHNEDTFLIADLAQGTSWVPKAGDGTIGRRGTVFLVADGMGGAAAGELASAMAAQTIIDHMVTHWGRTESTSPDEFTSLLRDALEAANQKIHGFAREHPDARGMGTTATVVGVLGRRLFVAQVGDSRAYLVRDSEVVQLTKDQSLMQRLIDAGELTEEQAAQSERRNIILQALGPDLKVKVEVTYQDLARGDMLILCSDGLSGQVPRQEIGQVVREEAGVEAVCDRLIRLANERGGPDNITVVAAEFAGALPPPDPVDDLGYHVYPLAEAAATVEAPGAPPEPEPAPPPPAPPAPRRTGGPLVMAAVVVAILALLLSVFFLLT